MIPKLVEPCAPFQPMSLLYAMLTLWEREFMVPVNLRGKKLGLTVIILNAKTPFFVLSTYK